MCREALFLKKVSQGDEVVEGIINGLFGEFIDGVDAYSKGSIVVWQ